MKYLALIIIPIVVAGLFVLLCYLTRKVFSKKASLELCQNVKAKQNNGFVSFIDNYFYYICGFVFVTYLLEFLAFWIIRNSLTFMWIFGFFVILVGMFVGYLILLKQHSNKYGTKNWAKDMYENEKTKSILSSLISIIIGLLIGCIILLLFAGRTCGGTVVTFKAAKEAIQSPLLETSIEGARGVIINITGGPDLGLQEANTAAELVQRSVDPEANIIFGVVTDESLGDEIQITVIATGFEKDENISTIGVENLVNNTWNKKINSIPSTPDNKSDNPNDLDIPSFLRKKGNKI